MYNKFLGIISLCIDNIYHYLVSGLLLLTALILIFDPDINTLEDYGILGSLIFILIYSYLLGLIGTILDWPMKKILRWLPNYKKPPKPDQINKECADVVVKDAILNSKNIHHHWRFAWFYFSLMMPMAVLGFVIVFHVFDECALCSFFLFLITILLVIAFAYLTNKHKSIFYCQILNTYDDRFKRSV